ncbi:response regulator [Komagataeibacter saccharivorans]|uniref:response regulator n=1 Tax=Komagataeibacter saccharivorans TaxID=265959 RepID=UPI000C8361E0|nr:response regulator [Komagataeibacter saccharivorans]
MIAGRGNAHILLVEDETTARDLYNAVLLGAGFTTDLAGSIAELRQCVRYKKFDVILLELHFPDGKALDIIPELGGRHQPGLSLQHPVVQPVTD